MSSDTSKINGINRRRFIQGSASFAVAAGLGSPYSALKQKHTTGTLGGNTLHTMTMIKNCGIK
ncbi:twin-arginine translocation signal domain-containing protein [Rhizobium leguminosarum]|uniref:twin-arginine translocation signal domain-containing protein n=1 Tax=Rhizobium leguminosarum TaxID=384 RepID=UPI0013DEAACF|nr:twin-arginine translocation signal domain-containing protein [Rhizobium leguminosarum]